jgi:starch synthase
VPPDVVHAHDWQTSLVLARLSTDSAWGPGLARAGRVLTIHNLAYQGVFPRETLPALGLPWELFRVDTGEFWGAFSCLKAGITSADYVTTVSPTYEETRAKAAGCGRTACLAKGDRYIGILNGIDTVAWDPRAIRMPAAFLRTICPARRRASGRCWASLDCRAATMPWGGRWSGWCRGSSRRRAST